MTKDLLWRGMLAGILAALLSTLFAQTFAEPQVDRAIHYEASRRAASSPGHHAEDEPELVSRATQKGVGLLTAMALYGTAAGGIFALVFAYGYGRLARIGPRSFAVLLAALAFVLLVVVPALKYPPTPPAVGRHETVGFRTAAYFTMLALSVTGAMIGVKIRTALLPRRGPFDATLVACLAYVLVVAVTQRVLPIIDEVPGSFPASVLWSFRVSALGTQAVLWATIGLAFGALAEHRLRRQA